MSNTWPKTSFVKVHEGCGGIVRWVEALDQPGVHYTGECQHCDREGIVVEAIIPLAYRGDDEYRDDILDLSRREREKLAWDEDAEFNENQKRLAEEIHGATPL